MLETPFTDPKGKRIQDAGRFLDVFQQLGRNRPVVADAFSSNREPPK